MKVEEYKRMPFKSDGERDILIGEVWDELPRRKRRYIQIQLKKGKIPNFVDVFTHEDSI